MKLRIGLVSLLLASGLACAADVEVSEAWARATVAQQKASGVFMRLLAHRDCRLLAAASPRAATVEVHEMRIDNEVMKMSPIEGLDLPTGKVVELKPGGFHLMLLDLKQRLQVGEQLPLSLVVQCGSDAAHTIELSAEIRPLSAAAGMPSAHGH
ncbi:MAG: copper chaperone PCu(A)C [Thauera sp.]|jgi:copper(I)-binding protein|nr:copper chaperone PCu(A)C [Thauera sp.]